MNLFGQKDIKEDPEQFASYFRIKFNLTSRASRKKETIIRMENITSGRLFTKLNQRFPQSDQVLLTSEDMKTLLSETVNNVLVESFSDSEVVSAGSELPIYTILEKMLLTAQEKLTVDSGAMWNSVFWHDDNSRPDKTAQTMNENYGKLDTEERKKLSDHLAVSAGFSHEVSAGGSFAGIEAHASSKLNLSTSYTKDSASDHLAKSLKENQDRVE